jgi:hypothetical protein
LNRKLIWYSVAIAILALLGLGWTGIEYFSKSPSLQTIFFGLNRDLTPNDVEVILGKSTKEWKNDSDGKITKDWERADGAIEITFDANGKITKMVLTEEKPLTFLEKVKKFFGW